MLSVIQQQVFTHDLVLTLWLCVAVLHPFLFLTALSLQPNFGYLSKLRGLAAEQRSFSMVQGAKS